MAQETKPAEYPGLLKNIRSQTQWAKRTDNGGKVPENLCELCGRPMGKDQGRWFMMDHTKGEIVDYVEGADEDHYSCYQVGSVCAVRFLSVVTLLPVTK